MNQTSLIFGAVLFAFIFYVTVKGDLPKWLGLLGLAGSPVKSAAVTAAPSVPAIPSIPSLTAPNGLLTGGT